MLDPAPPVQVGSGTQDEGPGTPGLSFFLMSGPMRGFRPNNEANPEKVGLPPRPFLYTLDQISVIIDLSEQALSHHIFYEGRSVGAPSRHWLLARNIAAPDQKPDWRVAEREFIRWLKVKGYKYYDRGVVTH